MRFLRLRWTRGWTIGLVLVLAAGATVAARQVTSYVHTDQPGTALAGEPASGDATAPAVPLAVPPGQVPPEAAELAPGAGSEPILGPPSIEPADRQSVPDTVSIQAGAVPDLSAPQPAAPAAGASGTAPFERPDVTTGEIAPPPRGFGVGIWAEPVGHFARLTVGVSGGPDGLAELTVDFGDGTTHPVPGGQIARLRTGGTLTLVHRYEPTLTPQPQRASVVATDGAGQTRQAKLEFETQAEFLASFSALTVTALSDCDFFGGKGDFRLRWNLDGRNQQSRFKLDKGQSYVEQDFRVGLNGLRYGDRHHYKLAIAELDSASEWLFTPWRWDLPEFVGPSYLAVGVSEIGTHTYPVTFFWDTDFDDDCHVRLDFTYTVALPDTPPHPR